MKDCKQAWWKEAKYGLFIHWGLYAKLAGSYEGRKTPSLGEWIMKALDIPVDAYAKLADTFNPTGFDAEEWVQLAKDAGMKYIVITAKHHDGFAMYHSKCSKYNIVDATPCGRDPIAELAAACQRADIKLCFYYSQAQDWHHPGGYGYGPIPDEEKDFSGYLEEKCKPQLRELLTQYGDIGLIWFDTPRIMSQKHSEELYSLVKELQPNCIVSGRIGNRFGEYMSTGDNKIPLLPFNGDWEVPATLNDTWGFKADDDNWKNPTDVLALLLRINSRGGNYLLNVGPDALGVIPEGSQRILRDVGAYVTANGPSIYGTRAVWGYPYEMNDAYFTTKAHHLYVHYLKRPVSIHLPHVNSKIKRATVLASGTEFDYTHSYIPSEELYVIRAPVPTGIDQPRFVLDFELEDDSPAFGTLDSL